MRIREMIEIANGKSISFDHTFRVAANIGFTREDGKWIYQYDSLFANKLSFNPKLTKETAFAQVEMLLKDLKERSNEKPFTLMIAVNSVCILK